MEGRQMKISKILILGLSVFALTVWAVEETRQSSGIGDTYRDAVNEALISALWQYNGGIISREECARFSEKTAFETSTVKGDERRQMLDDSITRSMKKWAHGKINGYTVLSESVAADGKYHVFLDVRFPGKYVPPGRDKDALRRMAVTTFNVRGKLFNWYGQPVETVEWVTALADHLNTRLTQTRKFTMLDRAFDKEVDAELARLVAPNAASEDAARLSNKLGTDYLVVGTVSFNDVQPPAINPLTHQPLPLASALFAEISYRVLIAPTGQLKWTDTVRLDAAAFAAADARSFISMSAETAAEAICEGMMANILPFEVVKVCGDQIVIGEGGKQLAEGDRFTVCVLGEPVKDARTGEVIDEVEMPVATVEVTQVLPKLSYAKIIGDASKVKVGSRLRRLMPQKTVQPQAPAATTIQVNGAGGVNVQF